VSARVAVHIEPAGAARRRDALAPLLAAPLGIAGPLVLWPAVVAWFALPLMAAGHLAWRGGRDRFAAEDRPRMADGLEWLVGLYGWASLAAPRPPWRPGPRAVRLRLPPPSRPPRASVAAARLVTCLPGAVAALLVGVVALLPWLALVLCVLVAGRAPAALRRIQARVLTLEAAVLCRQAAVTGGSSPGPPAAPAGAGAPGPSPSPPA
jgi:hypothetical protein